MKRQRAKFRWNLYWENKTHKLKWSIMQVLFYAASIVQQLVKFRFKMGDNEIHLHSIHETTTKGNDVIGV